MYICWGLAVIAKGTILPILASYPPQCLSLSALVLQATNTGVRRPGYEAMLI